MSTSLFNQTDDSEDLFKDTRMSFGDHIEVLRLHLIRAIVGFCVAMVLSLFIGSYVLEFIALPVQTALMKFYNKRVEKIKAQSTTTATVNQAQAMNLEISRRELAKALNLPAPGDAEEEFVSMPIRLRPLDLLQPVLDVTNAIRPPTLSTLNITEAFMVYLKVSIYCGIVLASPWIFYQLWTFVAAGLYPHEKKYINVYLPFSLALFLAGVILCEWLMMPLAVEYLLGFNEWLGMEPDLRLNEWLSFAIMCPLVFGVAFQTPLIMLFLHQLGIVPVEVFQKNRRMAIFVLALAAAFLAASPDWFSMLMLLVPLVALYEFGIILCRFYPHEPLDEDEPDEGGLVGV
jgi:sec-independent protein translocase protein TatC